MSLSYDGIRILRQVGIAAINFILLSVVVFIYIDFGKSYYGVGQTTMTIEGPIDFYVSSSSGDDSNDGSLFRPFKTIQKASDTITSPGTTVHVLPGIYRERVAPRVSGLPSQEIKFVSTVQYGAIIKGSALWQPNLKIQNGSHCYFLVARHT